MYASEDAVWRECPVVLISYSGREDAEQRRADRALHAPKYLQCGAIAARRIDGRLQSRAQPAGQRERSG